MIWHDGLKNECTTPWGSHVLRVYSSFGLFLGAGLNPHPGRFKTIKKKG